MVDPRSYLLECDWYDISNAFDYDEWQCNSSVRRAKFKEAVARVHEIIEHRRNRLTYQQERATVTPPPVAEDPHVDKA
jgi:hypothetical protein